MFDNETNNTLKGVYYIESYYVLYSSQSVDKYSSSVCRIYNTQYFKPGKRYTFKNTIKVSFDVNETLTLSAEQASTFSLKSNSPPANGTCSASPDTVRFNHTLYCKCVIHHVTCLCHHRERLYLTHLI